MNAIRIFNHEPKDQNGLVAVFDLEFEMTVAGHRFTFGILNCAQLNKKDGTGQFIGFPRRGYLSGGSLQQFPAIRFGDRAQSDRFQELVFAALEEHGK